MSDSPTHVSQLVAHNSTDGFLWLDSALGLCSYGQNSMLWALTDKTSWFMQIAMTNDMEGTLICWMCLRVEPALWLRSTCCTASQHPALGLKLWHVSGFPLQCSQQTDPRVNWCVREGRSDVCRCESMCKWHCPSNTSKAALQDPPFYMFRYLAWWHVTCDDPQKNFVHVGLHCFTSFCLNSFLLPPMSF